MDLDEHFRQKRYDKRGQFQSRKLNDFSGPALWAAKEIKTEKNPETVWVQSTLVQCYQDGLTCVCNLSPEDLYPIRLLRDGIDWADYLPHIFEAFELNRKLPIPFRPLKKIPSQVLLQCKQIAATDLSVIIDSLRSGGFLPSLNKLSPSTCPPQMDWSNLRASFQDFRKKPLPALPTLLGP